MTSEFTKMAAKLDDIIEDLHAATTDCQTFEKKYGVLSEDFYAAYSNGAVEDCDNPDFVLWAGSYKIRLSRLNMYRSTMNKKLDIFHRHPVAADAHEAV